MSYVDSDSAPASWWRRNGWTLIALVFILLTAAFFRVWFNYGPAINDGEYRFAGNDDYYHWRVVENVQTTGHHLLSDPLLNYPAPAKNPRPPLYDWHAAVLGQVVHWTTGMPVVQAGQYALEWGSASWGTLVCIPVWLIGRALYSNRAGLWASFLLAATPAHIQRAGFGLGDHDAFIIFFLAVGFYGLIRAVQLTRDDTRVERWNNVHQIAEGFGTYIQTHALGLAYALVAGVSFAAIALAWEGWPYVPAIYMLYFSAQVLFNHLRRRDSTGDLLVMLIIMTTTIGLAMPYYWSTGNIGTTLNSAMYVLAAMVILSLVLIPTRDIPSVVVLPGFLGVGALALVLIKLVLPDVGRQLFSANGYFVQSKLYSTIAEAQRTELGVFVFSIGFMTFFLALIGSVWAIVRYFQTKDRAQLFVVVWAVFSIYMAFAAARFVFNAAPVFVLLAGWMVDKILRWMNLRERVRDFQSQRQDSLLKAAKSLVGAKQVAGALFLALTLVVPSVWFSFDAGFPSEARVNYRQNHPGAREFIDNQTGAFGQGFLDEGWLNIYGWLKTQDGPGDCASRPAHMAWWDYGFWEVALGCHPTVSDNFQNGHQLAGRFLAAQSEQEAVEWMIIRLLEGDRIAGHGGFRESVRALLDSSAPGLADRLRPHANSEAYDQARADLRAAVPDEEGTIGLYSRLMDATGWRIGYFLTDNRMLPLDFPETPTIESGSIFYAPVFLANKNPDDFVQTVYVDSRGTEYPLLAYELDANNVSRQLAKPRVEDAQGNVWFASGGGLYRATSDGRRIDFNYNQGQPIPLERIELKFKDSFYQTMFYKGYVGGGKPAQGNYAPEFLQGFPNAGQDLRHFRLVQNTSGIRLLKYYEGAVASGTVLFEATGEPLVGLKVESFDDFGIRHDSVPVDANGTYRVLLPFSMPDAAGGLKPVGIRVVSGGGAVLANQTYEVSEAEAHRRGDYNHTRDFSIAAGAAAGFVYFDRDRDSQYNATVDDLARGVRVSVDGTSLETATDANGQFNLTKLTPGQHLVRANQTGYNDYTASADVVPGQTVQLQMPLQVVQASVNGTLQNGTGGPLANVLVEFRASQRGVEHTENANATSDASGLFQVQLVPGGSYTAIVNATVEEGEQLVRYRGEYAFDLPIGSGPVTITSDQLALARTVESS